MSNNKVYYIYCHTNLINGKKYIGQTCQKPQYRWGHNGNGYRPKRPNQDSHFYDSIQKYGWDNFKHEILYDNLTQKQASQIEHDLIQQYDLLNPTKGYNCLQGGNNRIPSQETRKKQSIAAMNRSPVSKQTKYKLSQISKGINRTSITKNKMAKAAKNRERQKKQLNIKRERPVRCINTNEIFPSLRAAADWCGLAGTSGIALVCQHRKQKSAGVHPVTKEKLRWEYVNEDCRSKTK